MGVSMLNLLVCTVLAMQPVAHKTHSTHTQIVAKADRISAPTIQETSADGRYIHLSDNTWWEIAVKNRPITQSWITPVEIIVGSSGDADFPYSLTNSLTHSTVSAKKLEEAPSRPAEPTPQPSTKKQ